MRWRLVDRIDALTPWQAISGRKAVSFEEYSLYKPFGRKGEYPESLIIGTCVDLAQWLVMAGSDWQQCCLLAGVGQFRFAAVAGRGALLEATLTVSGRTAEQLTLACTVTSGGGPLADGELTVQLAALHEYADAGRRRLLWRELHAAA